MIDRDLARELAELEVGEGLARLRADGLLSPDGLDSLLDAARSWMRDDPSVGERLAALCRAGGEHVDSPAAAPRAAYVMAQGRAIAGDMKAALALIDVARAGFDALGLRDEALRTNLGRSQALNEMGRHDEALSACAEILQRLAPLDVSDRNAVELASAAHQNSGLCMELSGRFEEALDHYLSARMGYESLGEARAMAEVSYDRALVLLQLGQHDEALHALERAAESFRAGGFRALQVMALSNMAEVQLQRGEFQACLDSLGRASAALDDISWPGGEQVRLLVAGRAQLALNLLPEAAASFTLALETLAGTDLLIDIAQAEWGYGLAMARQGRTEPAVRSLSRAAEQFAKSGQRTWLSRTLVDRARVLEQEGDPAAAVASARDAVEAAVSETPAAFEAQLLAMQLEDGDDVAERMGAIRRSVDALSLPPLSVRAAHVHGRALLRAGRPEDAVEALRSSVSTIEALRGGLAHDILLSRFLDDKQSPYADLLTASVAAGLPDSDSLAVAEQAKSRTLADIVSGLVRRAVTADERFDADLHAAYSDLFAGDASADASRQDRLRLRVQDLERRRQALRLDSPAERVSGATRVFAAPDGVPLLSYAIAGDAVHVFVVADGETRRCALPTTATALAADVDRLRRHWDRFRLGRELIERHLPQLETSARQMLHGLYRVLVAPIEPLLGDAAEVVVVPDGVLHDVPFAALWDGETWWSTRREVRSAPSIETLRHLPEPLSGPAVVAGVPDELAPMVGVEVTQVAHLLPGATQLLDADATRDAVVAQIERSARIHLAGHAMFRPDNPMYSALRLADGWLTAADVLDLQMRGATVVLSACDSARTQHRSSAEINGFVRGFLGAGASSVVASQWTADDAATTALMTAFYEASPGTRPAAALRAAQEVVRSRWPHPYYWAPWVVTGR